MADILIVDDDVDMAMTLGDLLALEGHSVRVAHNGLAGLDDISDRFPELIVLDIEMPLLDGPGLALELLVLDAGRELIPIIMLSGFLGITDVAARLGIPYILPKPSSPEAICSMVARALAERIPPRPPPKLP